MPFKPSFREIHQEPENPIVTRLMGQLQQDAGKTELRTTVEKFEKIYKSLPVAAARILEAYKEVFAKYYKSVPGTVRLYMVGGRIQGKPLSEDSDIDLVFVVEQNQNSLESLPSGVEPLEASEIRNEAMMQVIAKVNQICGELEIPNEFHILNYGANDPTKTSREMLLLAEG